MQFYNSEMKPGDIVRIINSSGLPIGRWYMIKTIVGKNVYVTNNLLIKPFRLSSNTTIKVYSKMVVQVSAKDYKKLDKHYTNTFYHPISPVYDKLCDKQPEIIEFWCIGMKQRIYLRTDGIYRRVIDGEKCVRMYFVERIFRPLFT